ncbi:hypothetical protein [Metamycoplasma neophronis]|uniref:Uncharacterized protein n=1 Tax=Metamycoplasma neophronis TaxID=872983 RepID=A0ABY2Z0J2_9BACT|nr:hypothetical protein [Metamycoplasma neophronis]TPR53543.1 hypothetical protein FJR74_02535 [Metamycoplasma neophronis]
MVIVNISEINNDIEKIFEIIEKSKKAYVEKDFNTLKKIFKEVEQLKNTKEESNFLNLKESKEKSNDYFKFSISKDGINTFQNRTYTKKTSRASTRSSNAINYPYDKPITWEDIIVALEELKNDKPKSWDSSNNYLTDEEWKDLEEYMSSEIEWYTNRIKKWNNEYKDYVKWLDDAFPGYEYTGTILDIPVAAKDVINGIIKIAGFFEDTVKDINENVRRILPYMYQELEAIKERKNIWYIRALAHHTHKYINKYIHNITYTWTNKHQNKFINKLKVLIKISQQRFLESLKNNIKY